MFASQEIGGKSSVALKSIAWTAGCLDLGQDCKDPEDFDIKCHGRWPPRNKVLTVTVNREWARSV